MLLTHTARKRVLERLRLLFGGSPCALQAAALPWRKAGNGVEILMVTSRGTGRWVLPKGWPKRKEFLHEAAAREAAEEAGLSGKVSVVEAGRYYYDKTLAKGGDKRCEVLVFPIQVDELASEWAEKGERQRRWMTPNEAAASVAEPDLAELLSGFAASSRVTA